MKTSLSKNKNKSSYRSFVFRIFFLNSHWFCWYKDNRQRVRKNKPPVYITVYQQNPCPVCYAMNVVYGPPAECNTRGRAECNTLLHSACTRVTYRLLSQRLT